MVDRRLILTHEGAPVCWAAFAVDIRKRIASYPPRHAEVLQVWEVPSFETYAEAADITERFANEWATDLGNKAKPVFVRINRKQQRETAVGQAAAE